MKYAALVIAVVALTITPSLPAVSPNSDLFNYSNGLVDQSIAFLRLRDGKTLFARNSNKVLSPASLTKIVTSAAVLTKYSPRHLFETKIYYTGEIQNQTIKGNLIIVGNGDPLIVNEKLWELATDIRHLGIRAVDGNIIIDNSLFGDDERDASRRAGEKASTHAYDAPISAFGLNFNTFAIAMSPGDKIGKPANVTIDPYLPQGLIIQNGLRTTQVGNQIAISRITATDGKTRLVVNGNIPIGSGLTKRYRSISNPIWATGELFRSFLQKEGVQIRGQVKEGLLPANARLLHTMKSYELERIIKGLNQYSNNYIADVLVKRLGASFPPSGAADQPGSGTLENGVKVLANFLRSDMGIKTPFIIKNGSGLNAANRLSADQLVRILAVMEKRFDVFPEFLASLPTSGRNGTLEKRFNKARTSFLNGKVRAKTGTLTNPLSVAGLAGYIYHDTHGFIAFAIIENGISGRTQPALSVLRDNQDLGLANLLQRI